MPCHSGANIVKCKIISGSHICNQLHSSARGACSAPWPAHKKTDCFPCLQVQCSMGVQMTCPTLWVTRRGLKLQWLFKCLCSAFSSRQKPSTHSEWRTHQETSHHQCTRCSWSLSSALCSAHLTRTRCIPQEDKEDSKRYRKTSGTKQIHCLGLLNTKKSLARHM